MPDIANPYIPGQPVADPNLFFGRRDLLASIGEQLLKGRRVFVVAGAPRMGKSSLLRQLPAHLPEGFVAVRLDLLDEEVQSRDRLLWRLADAISRQLELPDLQPDWADFEGRPDALVDQFWPQVRQTFDERCLVLLLDDLDCLPAGEGNVLDRLIAALGGWRDHDPDLALVCTVSPARQEALLRDHARLFGGALTYTLGPLSSEEATRLITWPVDGVLTYDYGVARRLIEITSGQPYYLQLLCFEVFNRCAAAGWVNQRDVDLVVEDMVGREIADFRQVWDESSPQEQAVLAALVSLRGARGVATAQEVRTILNKAGARTEREQVVAALERLTGRGILQRLGALSYRFRVALLRDWLGERIDLEDVVRHTRWGSPDAARSKKERRVLKLSARRERRRRADRPQREQAEPAAEGEQSAVVRSPRWWIAAVALLAAALLVGGGLVIFGPGPAEPTPVATRAVAPTVRLATATLTRSPATATATRPAVAPSHTPTPLPTATPSPTPPLVVARSLPSIVYQSRGPGEEHWSIYAMNSDGSGRTRLTEGQFEAFSPVWSPDGSKIAFGSDRGGSADIWVMDSDGGNPLNLTQNEAQDRWPAWSPDGEWIAFASVRDALYWELYVMRADGLDVQRLTWWEDASDWSPSWSPDGTRLAFATKRDGDWEIYLMDRDGSNLLRLTDHPADDTNPAWSPDGGRIAFESAREGFTDIFVMPIGGGPAVNLTNLPWATDLGPSWSPDGGRIAFYSDRDGEWDIYVMASDGSDVTKLTGDNSNDQLPAWRP